jgi:hypothetical protein
MPDLRESSESTQVILSVIRELTGDTSYASFIGIITAKVRGKIEINEHEIKVLLTNNRPNYASIDILWEEHGYINYKQIGLYGRMTTEWQKVKITGPKIFTIYNDTYEIAVNYANAPLIK